MSSVGIEQLFQATASTRSVQIDTHQSEVEGERFRAHLEQASEAKKPVNATPEEDAPEIKEELEVESETDQHETSTTQQEEGAAANESSESANEAVELSEQGNQIEDDVVLSGAVAAAATEEIVAANLEAVAEAENNTIIVADAQSSTAGEQQPATLQTATQQAVVDATQTNNGEADTATAAALGTEASATLETGADNEQGKTSEANLVIETDGENRGEGDSANREQNTDATQQSETQSNKGSAGSEVLSKSQTSEESQQPENALQPTERHSKEHTDRKSETPASAAALATDVETELGETNNGPAAEVNTPATTSSSSNETTLATDRSLARLLPGRDSNASTKTDTESSKIPTVDRTRFVRRVGGAIRAAQQRDGQIQLRLSPPELGTLKIEMSVNNGAVSAKLETENAAARTVLLDNLPALRERLAEQDIHIEKFDVDVRDEGNQQSENPGANDKKSNHARGQAARERQSRGEEQQTEITAGTTNINLPTHDSGLDVRI